MENKVNYFMLKYKEIEIMNYISKTKKNKMAQKFKGCRNDQIFMIKNTVSCIRQ